jgi:hypothetical protein
VSSARRYQKIWRIADWESLIRSSPFPLSPLEEGWGEGLIQEISRDFASPRSRVCRDTGFQPVLAPVEVENREIYGSLRVATLARVANPCHLNQQDASLRASI